MLSFPGAGRGVESDAHRRFGNLRTRRAIAEQRASVFAGCRYIAGDLRGLKGAFGFVSWILPFVRPAAQRAWGLPDRFFEPAELLRHAWARVAPGGALWVVNQEAEEAELQGNLFATLAIP